MGPASRVPALGMFSGQGRDLTERAKASEPNPQGFIWIKAMAPRAPRGCSSGFMSGWALSVFDDPVPLGVLCEQGLRAGLLLLPGAGGAAPGPVGNHPVPLGVLAPELPAGSPQELAQLPEGLSSPWALGRAANPAGSSPWAESSPWARICVLSPSQTQPRAHCAPGLCFPAP